MQIKNTDLILNADGSIYHLHLLSENIARLILVVGDPNRVSQISKYFDRIEFRMQNREFITHTGYIGKKKITALSSGIGTDNVEIVLNELDALVNIDLSSGNIKAEKTTLEIIRIGTSGGLQKDIPVESFLVSEYAIGLDTLGFFYDIPQMDFEKRWAEDMREKLEIGFVPYIVKGDDSFFKKISSYCIQGNTITVPGFYNPQGRVLRIHNRFSHLVPFLEKYTFENKRMTNLEMETAGYYGMSRMMGHKAISVNAILANRVSDTFSKNPEKTIDTLIQKTLEVISTE
ncbi:MAG: nucleoside phosphorylase [Chitinophagaceae bacterium]|nr:nucleoside phosphorylase [Chitinophagaceae bacterium]